MSQSSNKSSQLESLLNVQTIVTIGITWSVLALLFFLLFSASQSDWYQMGTYIFEQGAWLGAAVLCLRNRSSSQIMSGRNVWLGIGVGTLLYFIGNWFFWYWETILGLEVAVSPGDLLFIPSYLLITWGMVLAVLPRRLNLEPIQWGIVALIAAIGVGIAIFSTQVTPGQSVEVLSAATTPDNATQLAHSVPSWALALNDLLAPFETVMQWFYIVMDIFLLGIATMLLLAFWGGRFSQSWRMIAAAAFSLYIADIWFKYASASNPNYQSGQLPEVFWVFSGILFAIGAALEYDVSMKSSSRRSRRRS